MLSCIFHLLSSIFHLSCFCSNSRQGNRRRAHVAALESKLKNTRNNSTRADDIVYQIDSQPQTPQDLTSNISRETVSFESQIGSTLDIIGNATSQPFSSELQSELVPAFQDSNFPMFVNSSSSDPAAVTSFDLGFHQVLPDFVQTETLHDSSSIVYESFTVQPFSLETQSAAISSSSSDTGRFGMQTNSEGSNFSDETYITVPGLSLIRAHSIIIQLIQRQGCNIDIWDPFSVSPFYQSTKSSILPPIDASLTENYRPTDLQKLVKHHPIFDLLPWPSARNKLIQVMSIPVSARPLRVQDDMQTVVMNMIYDMKDAGGGLRVWGQDPLNEKNWEVGQRFFELWWWALDSDIISNSNKLRQERGEDTLRLRKMP